MSGIHKNSIHTITEETKDILILESAPRQLGTPLFIVGACLFIVSMFTRGFMANALGKIAVIPLGIASLLLIAAIWQFSAKAKVILSKNDNTLFIVYKHLGYLQKALQYSLNSIEKAQCIEVSTNKQLLFLVRENGQKIWLAKSNIDYSQIALHLNRFLNAKF